MDEFDHLRGRLAELKPYLDDDNLPLIMASVASRTASSAAKEAIDRARVAEAVIHRARRGRQE
ncbi:hypothetical protein PQH03_28955 [Ralstonia insidiosa]|jgi:hypothetical protein|uniref:Uncharacterized protein n=1 Tax=Ralstonia insidiosa TaxID=190721 RepID=A0A192A7I2_9RALS|nr:MULTISPECIES: hypothetical protein [Ralstonia]KMW47646.1 hypothetical protein AC240_08895 [Ralstonia sp. MD27]ANJ76430.1 hypothetical protein A9Y76_27940 [Ralstonia insidiosa]MBA9869718.1 hypothetical protein [Ralstonia insidiosa]MBA9885002.1 hypothetical protein [Ralstonia pickettii]MBA9894776.1 hypothetical protein [Ralstonia pickettii]